MLLCSTKVGEFIEQGEYGKATLQAFTQLDRFLADSAPQMGLLAAGTLASGGLLTAAGVAGSSFTGVGGVGVTVAILGATGVALGTVTSTSGPNLVPETSSAL